MKALTQRQRSVLRFLQRFCRDKGFPPTMREIGQAIGLSNVSAVRGHLAALEKKGYIAKESDKARSIRIIRSPSILSRLKRKLHEVAHTDQGVIHRIRYGIAVVTRDRQSVFEGPLAVRMRASLEKRSVEHGWKLLEVSVEPDCVAVVVEVWPNHSGELVANRIRSTGRSTTHRLNRDIWAKGYAVTTDPDTLDELTAMLRDQATDGEADSCDVKPKRRKRN
ncbi:MAG: transposase [Phycisphaerae bacterium]|jgi:REP element-mobilizing transposase RayT|nr:transposase [Phycisphaerae bacterium]